MREAPSTTILNALYQRSAILRVYDPIAMEQAKKVFAQIEEKIIYCNDEYDAVNNVDVLAIITEWNQFRNLDLDKIKENMKEPYFFDLRNIYERELLENKGFKYITVGQ
ncbi:UDP binding domain-containing protein [Clostridiaceae bacterium 35-E11]